MTYISYCLRLSRFLPVLIGMLIAGPVFADANSCVLISHMSEVEKNLTNFSVDRRATLDASLKEVAIANESEAISPRVFSQITGKSDWLSQYLRSRQQIAQLYNQGHDLVAENIQGSPEFAAFSPVLNVLNAAFYCQLPNMAGEQNIAATVSNDADAAGESKMGQTLRQSKFSLASSFAISSEAILSFLFLAIAGAIIWIVVKFDDSRRNVQRRYYCNIDLIMRFAIDGQFVEAKGRMTDISRSGAAIESDSAIPENAVIKIISANLNEEMNVVRSNGRFVGATFVRKLKVIPADLNLSQERKFLPKRDYQKQLDEAGAKMETGKLKTEQ